jgi:hypothetical protein
VLGIATAQVWPWTDASNTHLTHVALHGFTGDLDLTILTQLGGHSSGTVERIPSVDLVDGVFDRNFFS